MARPRKDSEMPDARQRIIDAFWKLLESNPLGKITVGMVANEAGCNRGTFYYHFSDMDALTLEAIRELLDDTMLIRVMFALSSDAEATIKAVGACVEMDRGRYEQRIERFNLVMNAGEMHTVDAMTKRVVVDLWRQVLCRDGEELDPDARLIIEANVSGTLSFIASQCGRADPLDGLSSTMSSYVSGYTKNAIHWISEAQGMPEDEMVRRLKEQAQPERIAEMGADDELDALTVSSPDGMEALGFAF